MPTSSHPQLIRRLTPLSEALAHLDRLLKPVKPEMFGVETAAGLILAETVPCGSVLPPHPVAARDGYAVAAADLVGASSYAPAYLSSIPQRVDVGAAMPPDADTVIGEDSVSENGGLAEVSEAAAPGEHVRQRGDDAIEGDVIGTAGRMVSAPMIGAMLAAGVVDVPVRRPRIRLRVLDGIEDRRSAMLAALIHEAGAVVADNQEPADLEIRVGGTGTGAGDHAVADLGDKTVCHGIAIAPGASAAIAEGAPPLLLLPGLLDAMLGAWLSLARPAIDRLSGREARPCHTMNFTQKVISSIGVSDLFIVREMPEGFMPLPLAGAGLADIASARFWFAVDAGSEGFPAGQSVQAHAFAHK